MADAITLGTTPDVASDSLYAGEWLVTVDGGAPFDTRAARPLIASEDRRFTVRMADSLESTPATCASREVTVVFEGYLFEPGDLATRLGLAPSKQVTDAELVLRAYERWGERVASYLKGIFAFCLWDTRFQRLVAARDRLGIYPLYYSRRGAQLFLAPVIEAFAAPTGPGLTVNKSVVAGLLARHHPDLKETFYQGVERVPPGHYLVRQGSGRARTERYWDLPAVGNGVSWVEEEELPRFGELLDQAVSRALELGPAAIFLSGGLDSVSVAGAAVQRAALLGQAPPMALSLLFPGVVSEEDTQRGVAAMLGIEQHFLELEEAVRPVGLVAAALEASATGSAPLQNVWHPAYRKLALEAKAQGRRVILTGGGGDEWLTVSPVIAADYLRSLDVGSLFSYLSAVRRSVHLPPGAVLRNILWKNGLGKVLRYEKQRLLQTLMPGRRTAALERSLATRLARIPDWLAPDPAASRSLERRIGRRFWERASLPPGPAAGSFYFGDRNSSLDHPLLAIDSEEVFGSSRETGVMQFDIYWDADLVEFLNRVPPHLLNRGGRTKGLVRSEVAERFPGLGFDRQKKLVSRDFFCSLLLDQGEHAWRSLGGAPALSDLGLVDPARLQQFVGNVLANRDERHVDDVWRVMSLESWVRPRV